MVVVGAAVVVVMLVVVVVIDGRVVATEARVVDSAVVVDDSAATSAHPPASSNTKHAGTRSRCIKPVGVEILHCDRTGPAVKQHVKEAEPPRNWIQRLYNVQRWTVMPTGGHFAPVEEPELFVSDLAASFRDFAATR